MPRVSTQGELEGVQRLEANHALRPVVREEVVVIVPLLVTGVERFSIWFSTRVETGATSEARATFWSRTLLSS